MLLFMLFAVAGALEIGTYTKNYLLPFATSHMGTIEATTLTIDANWRWVHEKNGYSNCFTNSWVTSYCPDPVSCFSNCALEGVDQATYLSAYGVSSSGSSVDMKYVTKNQYGTNIGSRLYLLDATGKNYKGFQLKNRQFSFDVDLSQLPCGLNAAVYFVDIPLDGGRSASNKPGAPYGTGYGDAQCPTDIKYINGFANTNKTGACANEIDILESNTMATAMTPHVCSISGTFACTSEKSCGAGNNRYSGVCDKDGTDYNPYRAGDKTFYGPNLKVNTLKPFTIVTQFITDGTDTGKLTAIKRQYVQNGVTIDSVTMTEASINAQKKLFDETNHFMQLGGFARLDQVMQKSLVLVLSIWDDLSTNMAWLDSTFPVGSTTPGSLRGPCPATDSNALRSKNPNLFVTYSNVKVSNIASPSPSVPSPSPSVPIPSPSAPSTSPSVPNLEEGTKIYCCKMCN